MFVCVRYLFSKQRTIETAREETEKLLISTKTRIFTLFEGKNKWDGIKRNINIAHHLKEILKYCKKKEKCNLLFGKKKHKSLVKRAKFWIFSKPAKLWEIFKRVVGGSNIKIFKNKSLN